jgi:hypothetical protein
MAQLLHALHPVGDFVPELREEERRLGERGGGDDDLVYKGVRKPGR